MIANYAALKQAILDLSYRDDQVTKLALAISRAEDEIYRTVRTRDMEATFSAALVDGAAALPADFIAFKWLKSDVSNGKTLVAKTDEYIANQNQLNTTPAYFALRGANVVCYPTGGGITGVYYKKFASMTADADTNVLLTNESDLFLFGGLRYFYQNLVDPENEAKYQALFSEQVRRVNAYEVARSIAGSPLKASVR